MIPHPPSAPESCSAGDGQTSAEMGQHAARLIALKRFETPGPEYFERFLSDFQERQRSELLRLSVGTLVGERFLAWADGIPRGLRRAMPGAAAVLVGLAAAAAILRDGSQPSEPVAQTMMPSDRMALAEASLIREF